MTRYHKIRSMFDHQNQESFKKQLKELERQNEAFELEKKQLFDTLGMTPEEVHAALKDQSLYSQSDWERLQQLKKELEDQDRENIRDPEKAQKNYKSRHLPNWALFCR